MNQGLNDYWKFIADDVATSDEDHALWTPPDYHPDPIDPGGWTPLLNTTQRISWDDSRFVIVWCGEKGSGKSHIAGHTGVRHCYENPGALWVVVTKQISQGSEGFIFLLESRILPAWKEGNRHPDWLNGAPHPQANQLIDSGISLHFLPAKLDNLTKDRHIWMAAYNGQWSKIVLKSIPHATQVKGRMYGLEPSRVHMEEVTHMEGEEYFDHTSVQLNRRPRITGPQQWTATCNPEGPSHWFYKRIVEQAKDENGVESPKIAYYHVPITENLVHLNPLYQEQLELSIKNPYERRRLLDGEWVDTPAGDAIFKEYFVPEVFVKGDVLKGLGLVALPGFPIVVGHDPGPKNYSIHFEQRIPTLDTARPIIINVFDELNFVGKYRTYDFVVRTLVKRMIYWLEHPKVKWRFTFEHIADEAAFTTRRDNGSFDNLEIQRLFKKNGWDVRMRPCPKGAESQPQRVQMVIDYLLMEALYVSAMCEQTIDMFRLLPSKKLKDGEYDAYAGLRPQKCPHLHPFDSMSYPMWLYHVRPKSATRTDEVKSRVIFAGSNS